MRNPAQSVRDQNVFVQKDPRRLHGVFNDDATYQDTGLNRIKSECAIQRGLTLMTTAEKQ